jgi:RecG-like helicase
MSPKSRKSWGKVREVLKLTSNLRFRKAAFGHCPKKLKSCKKLQKYEKYEECESILTGFTMMNNLLILWWLHQDLKNTQGSKFQHSSSMTKSQLFHFLAFELTTAQSRKVKKFLYILPKSM